MKMETSRKVRLVRWRGPDWGWERMGPREGEDVGAAQLD